MFQKQLCFPLVKWTLKKKKPKHHELVSEAVRVFDEKLAIVLCFLITL